METSSVSSTVTILSIRHTPPLQRLLFSLIAFLCSSVHPLSLSCLPLKIDSGLALIRCTVGSVAAACQKLPLSHSEDSSDPRSPTSYFWSFSPVAALCFILTFQLFTHCGTIQVVNTHLTHKYSRYSCLFFSFIPLY